MFSLKIGISFFIFSFILIMMVTFGDVYHSFIYAFFIALYLSFVLNSENYLS